MRRRRKTKKRRRGGMAVKLMAAVMITAIGTRLPGDYDNKHKTGRMTMTISTRLAG